MFTIIQRRKGQRRTEISLKITFTFSYAFKLKIVIRGVDVWRHLDGFPECVPG